MLVKLSFYYRARDSTQDGVFRENVVIHLQPVRSNASLKPQQILYKKRVYFGMKKKESGEQRESTSANLVAIFKDYHST